MVSSIEKIKTISLKEFAARGFDGVSLENIASQVGIRKSSIYTHFKNKEDLFLSVFEEALRLDAIALKNLAKDFKEGDSKENLASLFRFYCQQYNADAAKSEFQLIKRAMLYPPENLKEKLKEMFLAHEKEINSNLELILTEGIDSGQFSRIETEELYMMFYIFVDGLFIESHYYPDHVYNDRFDAVWKLFWDNVSAKSIK